MLRSVVPSGIVGLADRDAGGVHTIMDKDNNNSGLEVTNYIRRGLPHTDVYYIPHRANFP